MLQVREQPRFARSMSRRRAYTVKQSLGFLMVIPLDVAFLVIVIMLVGFLIKIIA